MAKTRLAAAPDIPSVDEAGLPGLYISSWRGLWAPKGTPRNVISKLNAAEAGCTTQVTQAVSTSKVAAKVQPALATAKSQIHGGVAPIVAAIKSDEDRFEMLALLEPCRCWCRGCRQARWPGPGRR